MFGKKLIESDQLTEDQRRVGVQVLVGAIAAIEMGEIRSNKIVIAGKNFQFDKTRDCGTGADKVSAFIFQWFKN